MIKWLNYHHLLYFRTIATEGSISRASEKLSVGQSALSSQLKQLEESIGQQLFQRKGRSLELTEAGKVALEYAEEIFQKGEEFVGRLVGVDENNTVITVTNPKIVVIAGEDVALVPFALTAKTDTVFMQVDQLLTILETMETAAEDYLNLIQAEKELAESAKFAEEEVARRAAEEVEAEQVA